MQEFFFVVWVVLHLQRVSALNSINWLIISSSYSHNWCVSVELLKMTTTKSEMQQFNAKRDFDIWQQRMRAILVQQKVAQAL